MYPKETVEAAKGLIALAKEIAALGKDGFQLTDALMLAEKLKEEPLKSIIATAQAGIEQVPAEVKQIDLINGFKVALDLGPEVVALVEAIQKKA